MSRWLFLVSCLAVLASLWLGDARRASGSQALGGPCEGDLSCQVGMSCADVDGVLEGQCTSACNDDTACHEQYGGGSLCIGADRCVRACDGDAACAAGTHCNAFGWCEAPH